MKDLVIVARGKAVEEDGALYFQKQDSKIFRELCLRKYRVTCLISIVEPKDPYYDAFSHYDARISDPSFKIKQIAGYRQLDPGIFGRVNIWMRYICPLWHQICRPAHVLIFMPSPVGFMATAFACVLHKRAIVYYGGDWTADLSATSGTSSWRSRIYAAMAKRIRTILEKFVFKIAPILLLRDQRRCLQLSRRRDDVYLAAPAMHISSGDLYGREDTCQNSRIRCLTVCSILPNKGIPDILIAMRVLRRRGYDVDWHHAGSSHREYFQEIKNIVRDLDLVDNVTFHGYCGTEELLSLYREADIFVLASHSEGFPRAVIEALSQGLPAVSTCVGGIPSALIDGHHALLTKIGSPRDLALAISRIISDDSLRKHLISNGHSWASKELAKVDPAQQIDALLRGVSNDT